LVFSLPSLAAASAYFAVVFAVGFIFGAARIVLLVPVLGEVSATAAELPFMLILSWVVCAWLRQRFSVGVTWGANIGMGVMALALLLVAETLIGVSLLGRALAEHVLAYAAPGPALGLGAQLVFASFPAAQAYLEREKAAS